MPRTRCGRHRRSITSLRSSDTATPCCACKLQSRRCAASRRAACCPPERCRLLSARPAQAALSCGLSQIGGTASPAFPFPFTIVRSHALFRSWLPTACTGALQPARHSTTGLPEGLSIFCHLCCEVTVAAAVLLPNRLSEVLDAMRSLDQLFDDADPTLAELLATTAVTVAALFLFHQGTSHTRLVRERVVSELQGGGRRLIAWATQQRVRSNHAGLERPNHAWQATSAVWAQLVAACTLQAGHCVPEELEATACAVSAADPVLPGLIYLAVPSAQLRLHGSTEHAALARFRTALYERLLDAIACNASQIEGARCSRHVPLPGAPRRGRVCPLRHCAFIRMHSSLLSIPQQGARGVSTSMHRTHDTRPELQRAGCR